MALSLPNEQPCYVALHSTAIRHELSCASLIGNGMTTSTIALPKTEEQTPSERQGLVADVESWLTMLEASDDTDQLLNRLLHDGTARAMIEEEIEVAREKKLHDGKSREGTLRSLDLPLQNSVPLDRTVTGERDPASTANRIAMRRPNIFQDFAVQDTLAGYDKRYAPGTFRANKPTSQEP